MIRKDYEDVRKSFNINNNLSDTIVNGDKEKVYYWNDLAMWFSNGYAVIKGRIPFILANSIFEKYPNKIYEIRVNGGSWCDEPKDYAIDEQYEREIYNFIEEIELNVNSKKYIEQCKNSLKRLKRRNNLNKYVTCYHIDTKEGFNIFLNEYSKYIVEKKEQEKEKIINEVSKTLYKKMK